MIRESIRAFVILMVLTLGRGLSPLSAQQVVLSDTLPVFGERLAQMLEGSRDAAAAAVGTEFRALWPNAFSPAQQTAIVGLALRMQELGYRPLPSFRDMAGVLVSASRNAGLSAPQYDRLLAMLGQSLEQQKAEVFGRELAALQVFFERRALYHSRYNRLYALNGQVDFEFAMPSGATPDPVPEEPAEEDPVEADPWESTPQESNAWEEDAWSWESEPAAPAGTTGEDPPVLQWSMPEEELPAATGSLIRLDNVDLVFVTDYDSVSLSGTSGSFSPHQMLFLGEGGRFDWSAAGMENGTAYAVPGPYALNVRRPAMTAGKSQLHYPDKFDRPVEGHFEYKSLRRRESSPPGYPRFYSYQNGVEVKDLGDPLLRYLGGVALEGRRLIGAATDGSLSRLEYRDQQGSKFRIHAGRFDFGDSTILSRRGAFTIYHGHDSIAHPSVKSWYYPHRKELRAVKELDGYTVQPFSSSYFSMTINADAITWDLEADSLNIGIMNARSMLPAVFKSVEYYNEKEINELTGLYNFHPLMVVYNYGSKKKSREFYLSDLIAELKINPKAAQGAMLQLKYLDYIEYEEASGRIFLKDKALHYVRSKNNQKDYDELLIPSRSGSGPNATLRLGSQELVVRGIEKFYISETLDVYMLPKDNQIMLLKNRDFSFDGQVFAGNFEFVGRNFTFRYDSFLVDLQNIDSIRFYVERDDSRARRTQVDNKMVSLDLYKNQDGSTLESGGSTSGTLYVNRPDNKSGRKIYPDYPIFDASRGAVVYFDNEKVLEGAYDKSTYFIVPPFTLDSLSNSDPATVGFDGVFVSGGILPDITETLRIMPDNSLGFVHKVPPEGYPLYGGKGVLHNQVSLDKGGLVATGQIDFLSSSGQSEAYVLFQDSVLATGRNFNLAGLTEGGASFPELYTPEYRMKWLPYQDTMYVYNATEPFTLYDGVARLDGRVGITPTGVSGSGTMNTQEFTVESPHYAFAESDFSARNAYINVGSAIPDKPLMEGEDIRLDFDLDQKIATLQPEVEGDAALDFPYAQVRTSISKATWDVAAGKISMSKPPEVDISQSYFYTTRKELDSLAFNAEAAEYDLTTQQLRISGIPHIMVADAYIIPENNEVLILENATIGELRNTTIVLDTLNEYHRLTDGTINIVSRKEFTGTASYQFVTARSDTFNIQLGQFELWKDPLDRNAPLQTVSRGAIAETDRLLISDGMYYKGDVTMYARNRALELEGFVKPDLPKRSDFNTWIAYRSQSEETQDVVLDFNRATTESGRGLHAGLYHKAFSSDLYFNFLEEKELETDDEFFRPEGMLRYDPDRGSFIVEDTAKADGNRMSGKLFAYNHQTGDVEFEGPFRFMRDGAQVQLEAAGSGRGNVNQLEYGLDITARIQYNLPDQVLMPMAVDLFEMVENYSPPEAEPDYDALLYRLAEFIGDRAVEEFDKRSASGYVPLSAFSTRMIASMLFTRLNLKWSPEYNAWYSTESLGLSGVLRADINASLEGFMEIQKTQEGDNVNLFIKASGSSWYFFGYQDNRLILYSSNQAFNDEVNNRSNVGKAAFGEYVFALGDFQDAQNFITRFRANYLGITLPYDIRMPVDTYTEAAPALVSEPPAFREVSEDQVEEIIVDKTGEQMAPPAAAQPSSFPEQKPGDVEEIVVEKAAGQNVPVEALPASETESTAPARESAEPEGIPVQRAAEAEEIIVEKPATETARPAGDQVVESPGTGAGQEPSPARADEATAADEAEESTAEAVPGGKGREKKKKGKPGEEEKVVPEPVRKPPVEEDDTEGF
jgi:hypothetical protein